MILCGKSEMQSTVKVRKKKQRSGYGDAPLFDVLHARYASDGVILNLLGSQE